ncbi:hypothetical protein DWB68_10305 [Galactobacter valiniphilus]|uniref:Uncharacterized protein n=1 Tax=Galactobacter valiniphilus TaxID=2676122 RepID=A0A399JCD7_9MICC|nr:hypothetical protein [Galactobacter valiniphilus]RII41909.1 hypothetical protein DWB68_10305 [Galactobacter valiniphilus]
MTEQPLTPTERRNEKNRTWAFLEAVQAPTPAAAAPLEGTILDRPTATELRKLTGYNGDTRLYRMTPPYHGNKHVIVSAAVAYGNPETYLFPADASGEVTDWTELPGSLKGHLDHTAALEAAGYQVVTR